PRHIRAAICIDSDVPGDIEVAAAEIRGVAEDRINHERLPGIVWPHLKSDSLTGLPQITTCDFLPRAIDHLINDRLVLAKLCPASVENQIVPRIDLKSVNAFKMKRDGVGVAAGRDHKIIFQLALAAVADQIDARINLLVLYPGIS